MYKAPTPSLPGVSSGGTGDNAYLFVNSLHESKFTGYQDSEDPGVMVDQIGFVGHPSEISADPLFGGGGGGASMFKATAKGLSSQLCLNISVFLVKVVLISIASAIALLFIANLPPGICSKSAVKV